MKKLTKLTAMLLILAVLASCDLCTLFGLDYDPSTDDTTVDKPIEEETKNPGYFYISGNTEDYLSIDAVEIIPNESSITAVDNEGKEESIDLTDNKYRLGRATIRVEVDKDKTIILTRSGKEPLVYTYEE